MRVVQFLGEVRCKTGRGVGDAAPYGSVIDGAVRWGDVGIGPYGDYLKFLDGRCGCCDFL